MIVQHKQSDSRGIFFIEENGHKMAELIYASPAADRMVIEHTEVNRELRGKNIGYLLVDAAVEYARGNNIKIVPVCQFAKSVFQKKKDYADVLG